MTHKFAYMYIYIHMLISAYIFVVVIFPFLFTTDYLNKDSIYVKAIGYDIT